MYVKKRRKKVRNLKSVKKQNNCLEYTTKEKKKRKKEKNWKKNHWKKKKEKKKKTKKKL